VDLSISTWVLTSVLPVQSPLKSLKHKGLAMHAIAELCRSEANHKKVSELNDNQGIRKLILLIDFYDDTVRGFAAQVNCTHVCPFISSSAPWLHLRSSFSIFCPSIASAARLLIDHIHNFCVVYQIIIFCDRRPCAANVAPARYFQQTTGSHSRVPIKL
jgi:hypothetical protein